MEPRYLVFVLATVATFAVCQPIKSETFGRVDANFGTGLALELKGYKGDLKVELGLPPLGYEKLSEFHLKSPPNETNIEFQTHGSYVQIHRAPTGIKDVDCYTVKWFDPPNDQEDCIDLEGASWYGGGELLNQHWPIKNLTQSRNAYVTGDFFHHPYGGVIERVWYNSKGYSIVVDEDTPLFLRFNNSGDGKMCFSASYDEYPYSQKYRSTIKTLSYTACTAKNIRDSLDYTLNRWIKKPKSVVDIEVIDKPIWSTWAKYKAVINQSIVLKYAKEIADHGFKASHVEVDDKWECCYGQLEFDKIKFPDPAEMIRQIKAYGFGVSFWVHPFVNTDCPAHKEGQDKKYFVREAESPDTPFFTTWWEGNAGYIDYTNPDAANWYIDRLKKVQTESGLDTFKFDAGELRWLNGSFLFNDPEIMKTPTLFTQKYTQTVAKFGSGVEVRVAYKSQDLPIFIRMLDKDSVWDHNNGLKSMIPTALLFSSLGYPFVLPDMIGGNAYGDGNIPEKELFIRWLQVNVFMPSLQFSITPWDYDPETIDISKKMVDLHEHYKYVFQELSQEAVRTGNPIVRPLWWNDPEDENALESDSQFLLGNDILVAPVVDQGARERDIYFPRGNWRAQMEGDTAVYTGPKWVKGYKVRLDQLPFFAKA